jgi:ketosteroid isomerase-like protein
MKSTDKVSNLVRNYFSSYESKDRKALEDLLSDDFSFSSPFDDHINKTDYLERCWPNGENIQAFHIEKLFEVDNEAFICYEVERKTGAKFRNTEYFRVEGNKIREVEVFFGSENSKATSDVEILATG